MPTRRIVQLTVEAFLGRVDGSAHFAQVFSRRVGSDAIRPDNRTAVRGLWLAGDYTATGLPATLESAVRSGQNCAQTVMDAMQS